MELKQSKQNLNAMIQCYLELPQIIGKLEQMGFYSKIFQLFSEILNEFIATKNSMQENQIKQANELKSQLKLISSMIIDDLFDAKVQTQTKQIINQKLSQQQNEVQKKPLEVSIDLESKEVEDSSSYKRSKTPAANINNSSKVKAKNQQFNSSKKYQFSTMEIMSSSARLGYFKSQDLTPNAVNKSLASFNSGSNNDMHYMSTFGQQLQGATSFSRSQREGIPINKQSPGPCKYNVEKSIDFLKKQNPSARIGTTPRKQIWTVQDTPGPSTYYPITRFKSK